MRYTNPILPKLCAAVPDQLKNVLAKCLERLVALLKVDVADIAQLRGLALAVLREDVQGVLKGGERLVDLALAEVEVADVVDWVAPSA